MRWEVEDLRSVKWDYVLSNDKDQREEPSSAVFCIANDN